VLLEPASIVAKAWEHIEHISARSRERRNVRSSLAADRWG
jgi:hypothetical protein